jgi:type VI secretion system secreted protein VgrG
VQYEESDFDFISRLLEYHGIHYHFSQNPTCECLVVGDDNRAFVEVSGFERVAHQTRAATDGEGGLREMTCRRQPLTGKVNVRDYNWRTPTTPLREEHDCDSATGQGVSDFFGDHFADGAEGAALAQIRAEEMMVHREVYGAQSSIRQLRAGAKVELHGHLSPDFDQEYLVIEVEESMGGAGGESRGGSGYSSSIRAITFETPFRPGRRAKWPRIDGIVNAKIDGEVRSTATPIDGEGRYKVAIPYDTKAKGGGKASRWVRMAQPSAGNGYGMHFPLHVGTEVAIMHVNGDPDRPIIIGAVPNAETLSPVNSNNATHSQIKTGSGLLIEFDDDC